MQITRAGEYGVLGLLNLVRRGSGATAMIDEVSREEAIPPSFLGKIFQSLARAGLVRSVRGAGGGFRLLRAAERISVLEVIEAVQGPIVLQRCLGETDDCSHLPACPLCGLLAEAQTQLRQTLARRSLADLAGQRFAGNPRSAPVRLPRRGAVHAVSVP